MRAWILVAALAACGLEERPDFLIGRQCTPGAPESCDPEQVCLPHQNQDSRLSDFRCRDRASFEQIGNQEPPLAYCNADFPCPGDLVCNADRIRVDGGRRPLVCKRPDDLFSPPLEGG